jgi:glucosamine--fructose-6-phosphate aminotransferase (isomerizing)
MSSIFREEIGEQPAVAARLLSEAAGPVAEAAREIRDADPAGLLIAARGSSDHAATYAKYLFEIRNRLPVALAAPSAFGLYGSPPRVERFCVVGISQSGASVDICTVLEQARDQGALTVALTNQPDSRLARAARVVLDLRAGPERSVPASKTYLASLVLLAMLSDALDPDPDFSRALRKVPDSLRQAIDLEGSFDPVVEALDAPRMAVLGRGYHLATAEEVALKITETCYSVAEAQSIADFLHGPVAAVEPGFPVLLLEAAGPALQQMRELSKQLAGLGAQVVRISDDRLDDRMAISVATGLPESLTPLPLAVAGQLLALRLALLRGLDPDRPRGLRKVTITL